MVAASTNRHVPAWWALIWSQGPGSEGVSGGGQALFRSPQVGAVDRSPSSSLLFSTWHLLPPHPQGCSKELFCIKHATGVGVQVCWPQGGGGKVPGDPYCSQAKGVFSAPPGPEFFMQ